MINLSLKLNLFSFLPLFYSTKQRKTLFFFFSFSSNKQYQKKNFLFIFFPLIFFSLFFFPPTKQRVSLVGWILGVVQQMTVVVVLFSLVKYLKSVFVVQWRFGPGNCTIWLYNLEILWSPNQEKKWNPEHWNRFRRG